MKYKFLTLSLLLAGACATTVMAQDTNYYTPKWSDNIFVSVGGGIHAVANDGFQQNWLRTSVSRLGKIYYSHMGNTRSSERNHGNT